MRKNRISCAGCGEWMEEGDTVYELWENGGRRIYCPGCVTAGRRVWHGADREDEDERRIGYGSRITNTDEKAEERNRKESKGSDLR